MKLNWLASLTAEERREFISYLRKISGDGTLRGRYMKAMRLTQIYIPVIKHGGQVPANLNFVALVENCGANLGQIRIELLKLYSDFQTLSNHKKYRLKNGRFLNSRQASQITGLSPRKIRILARQNKIKGAIKQGRHWRFQKTTLLAWSQ